LPHIGVTFVGCVWMAAKSLWKDEHRESKQHREESLARLEIDQVTPVGTRNCSRK